MVYLYNINNNIIMKKTILTKDQIKEVINIYSKGIIGLRELAFKYGITKPTIKRIMLENGGTIDNPGGKWKGGKEIADKRYRNKPSSKIKQKIKHKKWADNNKEHLNNYHKRWRDKNRERIRKQRRENQKERMKDPIYKLNQYIKTALWAGLKENDVNKYIKTWDILPFTLEELRIYLESLFTKNMTWKNYGEWHIDHIIPQDKLPYNSIKDENFLKCWSLDNLRPMWKTSRIIDDIFYEGNLNKGNRI